MNAQAAEALYEAERKGIVQVRGAFKRDGGVCAFEVIDMSGALLGLRDYGDQLACPCCGEPDDEAALIVHLNDDHGLTFAEIARKLGPDSA